MPSIRFELLNEFQFNRRRETSLLVCVTQKFSNSCASDVAIIASKFVHVHADELAGELRVHVTRVGERISDRFVPMRKTVVDAFPDDPAEVASHRWRNILAHHVPSQGQWQPGLVLPPFTKIDDLLKTGPRVCELTFVNDQTGVRTAVFYGIEDLVERNNDEFEFAEEKLKSKKRAGHRAWDSNRSAAQ